MNNREAPQANVITLGTCDRAGLRDFYRGLGWPLIMDDGELAAFELRARSWRCSPQTSWPQTGAGSRSTATEASASRSAYFVDPEGNYWEIAGAPPTTWSSPLRADEPQAPVSATLGRSTFLNQQGCHVPSYSRVSARSGKMA
jgi:hypothetical protein